PASRDAGRLPRSVPAPGGAVGESDAAAAEDDGVRHRETEAGNGKREGRACPLIATSQARMHVREAESTGRTCFFPSSVSRSGSSTTRGRTLELALRV